MKRATARGLGRVMLAMAMLAVALAGRSAVAAPATAGEAGSGRPDDIRRAIPRPKIGLVLSGGGARGYAHLGVLRVLEQNHIPIDFIAGTSMGAVIGGLYASGIPVETLIARLSKIDLGNIAFDRSARADLSQAMRDDETEYPIGIRAGYGDGQVKLPTGFVRGNRFLLLLQDWMGQYPANTDFGALPIPFRAVATNLETGEEVVLKRGSLPQAVRASMAAPGLFTPMTIDGRLLVDGALVANLPVQVVQQMGADRVIAVDVGSPLRKRADIHTPLAVADQMLGILVGQNVETQKALLHQGDVLISPKLGDLGFSDFSHAQEGIEAGEAAALAALPKLRAFALGPEQYAAFRAGQLARAEHASPRIDHVEIVTAGGVSADFVRRYLKLHAGDRFDAEKMKESVQAISTAGYFDGVTWEMIEKPGDNTLRVDAKAASWGPNLFFFGLALNTNFDGDGAFRLSVGHRYPWIDASGLEWRNDAVLGSDLNRLRTELRQPFGNHGDYYLAPYAEASQQKHNLFLNDVYVDAPPNPDPLATYQLRTLRAGLDVGIPVRRLGELRAGITYVDYVDKPKSYLPDDIVVGGAGTGNFFPTSRSRLFGPRVRLVLDQLDDPLFPRSGYYLDVQAETSVLDHGSRYTEARAKAVWATGLAGQSINLALEAGGDFGVGAQARPLGFFLGGFQHLSAFAPDQFGGNFMLYGRATWLSELRRFDAPPFRSLFGGLSAEVGNVWLDENDFGRGSYLQSYSAFVGLTSGLGPVYFGVAFAPRYPVNVYLQLGAPF